MAEKQKRFMVSLPESLLPFTKRLGAGNGIDVQIIVAIVLWETGHETRRE
ncbi:hypothetical protein ACF3MZ_10855 [Paenibacillaceae bacterium WGS1546]